jgi:hypothetical protein
MQQFLEAQTQLLQNLTNTVTNLQAQVNNPPVPPPAPRNKHREFMSHHPPVFTHATDTLEAEDWLKTVLKMLTSLRGSLATSRRPSDGGDENPTAAALDLGFRRGGRRRVG